MTDLALKPHETRPIDIRKLRDAQKADFLGHVIPANASDGSVTWIRLSNLPIMGRLVEIQRHQGTASSYQCGSCLCAASYDPGGNYMSPASANMLVQGTASMAFYAAYYSCNGGHSFYNRTGSAAWSSQYTSIATVNSGTVTGQSGGTSTITAQYSDYIYTFNPILFYCTQSTQAGNGNGPANVVDVSVSGPSNVALRAAGSTGPNTINLTATGTPSGGSYSWTTTSSKVTLSNTTSPNVTVTSASASAAVGDVPVKVTYTYNGTP